MKNEKDCCFKTSIGGQALMEGVMMRGPQKMCIAVRQPDGDIYTEVTDVKTRPWKKWVFVRGIFNFVDSLVSGYKCLMKSADIALQEEQDEAPGKFDLWIAEKFGDKGANVVMTLAALLGGALALLLFLVFPTALVGFFNDYVVQVGVWRTLLEGILKIALLVGYMAAVSRMKEIARLFSYHGAEHKTIACYEAGEALTVENVRKHTRFHPRCGTSFLLIVLVISTLLVSVVTWSGTWMRILLKLLMLPLVMGISYEIIKLCGRYDNPLTRVLAAPGLWLQHITTNEPDDGMMACAITAMEAVLPEDKEQGKW